MGFFSKKVDKNFLGIDIGLSGIKLVELVNDGKGHPRLVTYAYINRPLDTFDELFTTKVDETATIIKEMMKKARTTTKIVVSALPVSSVINLIINVVANNDKELQEAILWQAKKVIPMPLEEVQLDWKVLDRDVTTKSKKNVSQVLLTGAPKTLVSQYVDLLNKRVGLNLISLETETLAQVRSLIGNDRSTIMVIDIGYSRTNIVVVDRGIPSLNRSIAFGGKNMTEIMSKLLSIDLKQAETIKKDMSNINALTPDMDLNIVLETLMKQIISEVKYSFSLYQNQADVGERRQIDKIIVTGGSAMLFGLDNYLTKVMNVNTYVGDPWARVVYPLDLDSILKEIGARFSVAIGCAMRDINT